MSGDLVALLLLAVGGLSAAFLTLLVGSWVIRFVRDFRSRGQYAIWRRLFWLPERVYYWLLDRFTDNDGWRPLFYRGRDR